MARKEIVIEKFLLVGIFAAWATGTMAHSPLESTTPADAAVIAAVIAEVPVEVLLDFKGEIRLTRVTMTHADHPGIDPDLSGHTGFITDYAIPFVPIGSGDYVLVWRGLGKDGHALTGTFGFVVQ